MGALVLCDGITLRLGKLASIAAMVSKIAETNLEDDPRPLARSIVRSWPCSMR